MFKDTDYNNFPFIISSVTDFKYEIHSIKNKIIPRIESQFKSTRHISLKAYDLIINNYKKLEIRPKDLHNIILINMDAITRNGSFCICLLGEHFEDLFDLFSQSDAGEHDTEYFNEQLKESVTMATESGYSWISDELQSKEPSLLELLCIQAGLMAKVKFPLFYFRVSSGPISDCDQINDPLKEDTDTVDPGMERLKQKLIRNGLPIRFYGSAAEFDNVVEKDIADIISNYPVKSIENDDFFVDQTCFEKDKLICFSRNATIDGIINELDCFRESLIQWTKPKQDTPDMYRIEEVIKDFYRKDFSDKLQSAYKKLRTNASIPSSGSCEGIRILILSGPRCSGKSSILANWLSNKEDKSITYITHYCEASSEASDLRAMLRRIINSIRSSCGFKIDRDIGNIHSLECELRQLNQELFGAMLLSQSVGVRLLLIIDGLDHLGDRYVESSKKIKDIQWIPEFIPDNIRLVLTCTASDYSFLKLQHCRDDVKVSGTSLEVYSEADVLKSGLEGLDIHVRNYSQECSENIYRNVKEWPLICNPIVQKIIAHVFHTVGRTPNWDTFLDTISECHSVVELVRRVMKIWISFINFEIVNANEKSLKRKYAQRKEEKVEDESFVKGWIPDCLSLIVLTRNGLFIDSIPLLLKRLGYVKDFSVSDSDIWTLFHLAQGIMLRYHNAKFLFSHSLCKEIVAHTFLAIANCGSVEARTHETYDSMYIDKRCKFHMLLANLFWTRLAEQDENIDECLFHLDKSSDYETLATILLHPRIVMRLLDIIWSDFDDWLGEFKSIHKFLYYWQLLANQGYNLVDKLKEFIGIYYHISLDHCQDIPLSEDYQTRYAVSYPPDKKNSAQSDFAKKLKIKYQDSDEADQFSLFSTNQTQRYLYLLGRIMALIKQKSLAREIYSNVVKISTDDILLCHVIWSDIKLENLYLVDDNQKSEIISKISAINDLVLKVNDVETDIRKLAIVNDIRCLTLVQQCSFKSSDFHEKVPYVPLGEIKSLTSSMHSVVLNSLILELESDAIAMSDNENDIQCKLSLLSRAIVSLETWTGPLDIRLAKLWMKLGNCLKNCNYQSRLKAEACFRLAMSIWSTVRCENHDAYVEIENACREFLIGLLLEDICQSSVSEAKYLLFTTYDSRVKCLGSDHPDTKRLAPLIKFVSALQLKYQNGFTATSSDADRKSFMKLVRNSLTISKNNSNRNDDLVKQMRTVDNSRVTSRINSAMGSYSRPITTSSLQFINKYSSNSNTFHEDIDWDAVAAESGHQPRSCNVSAFGRRSVSRSTRTDLLSCDYTNISLRAGSSASDGANVPRNIYSGYSSSLSHNDSVQKKNNSRDSNRPKEVRFCSEFTNRYDRQKISDSIQAKLSQMQISNTANNWMPRKKSFSAVFSRPYYSEHTSMT